MSGLDLRPARPEDLAVVGAITVAAYAGFVSGPEDPYLERLGDAALRDREAELWVAVDEADGTVLGSVTLCPAGSPWRELARADEGEFRMLAVDPAAWGRGVGTALVGLAVRRWTELGARRLVLSSLPEMAPAHRLYERSGFSRAADRDWSAGEVTLWAFIRELGTISSDPGDAAHWGS